MSSSALMSLYDTVHLECPRCGREHAVFGRADGAFLNDYTLDDVPPLVAAATPPVVCSCGTVFSLTFGDRPEVVCPHCQRLAVDLGRGPVRIRLRIVERLRLERWVEGEGVWKAVEEGTTSELLGRRAEPTDAPRRLVDVETGRVVVGWTPESLAEREEERDDGDADPPADRLPPDWPRVVERPRAKGIDAERVVAETMRAMPAPTRARRASLEHHDFALALERRVACAEARHALESAVASGPPWPDLVAAIQPAPGESSESVAARAATVSLDYFHEFVELALYGRSASTYGDRPGWPAGLIRRLDLLSFLAERLPVPEAEEDDDGAGQPGWKLLHRLRVIPGGYVVLDGIPLARLRERSA